MGKKNKSKHIRGLWQHVNGTWYCEFWIEGHRFKQSTGTKDEGEAELFYVTYHAQCEAKVKEMKENPNYGQEKTLGNLGTIKLGPRMTIVDGVNAIYEQSWRNNVSGEKRKNEAMIFAKWLGEDFLLADIDQNVVTDLHNKMLDKGWGPATRTINMCYLRQIMHSAVNYWQAAKVMPIIQGDGYGKEKTEFMSREDETNAIEYFRDKALNDSTYKRYSADYMEMTKIIPFLNDTGIRKGEYDSMSYERWDENGNEVDTWIDLDHNMIISFCNKESRKSKKQRIKYVPMTEQVHAILTEQKETRFQRVNPNHPFSLTGKQLNSKLATASRALKAQNKLSVSHLYPHLSRHTCASWMTIETQDLKLVQEWLGHATLAMTSRYSHLIKGAKAQAASKMSQIRKQNSLPPTPPTAPTDELAKRRQKRSPMGTTPQDQHVGEQATL